MAVPLTFIFAGPSGSGKGTQVDLLKRYLLKKTPEIPQFSSYTGDGFRALMKGTSLTSRLAKEIQDAGALQPEFLAVYLWADNLIKNVTGKEHLFIDGSPRKIAESMVLDSAMQFYKRNPIHLILVNVSPAEAKRRLLLRARHDDSTAEVDRRLGWYTTEVVPAVNYLKDRPGYIFHDINGEQTPAEVHADILKVLQL
ncbi:MAG: Adenylate kinase [Parcubacteria group bacterium GW2011_GWA2_49_9]|nr:MAG: Adenylate kinase [Parcubacteria group bacterium GW2011_GWA2_49_9]